MSKACCRQIYAPWFRIYASSLLVLTVSATSGRMTPPIPRLYAKPSRGKFARGTKFYTPDDPNERFRSFCAFTGDSTELLPVDSYRQREETWKETRLLERNSQS